MLAATLIVRNESRCITRCLESVAPWVDRILVLDTGSTDDTAERARRCGAEVHHLPWTDDFSAARNHVLDLADADWNLVIDADEWIASGGDKLRNWCDGRQRLGRVCILSSFDAARPVAGIEGTGTSRSWITRILPRGVRYQGRIHEQAVSMLPRERIELQISHDGYLDAQMERKRDRNRTLLLKELQQHPDDSYLAYQLGREAEGRGEFLDACDWYARSLALTPRTALWFHELFVRQLHCLGQAERVDEGLEIAWGHMEEMAESPDFFFVFGNLLLEQGANDPARAVDHWLPLAAAAWERCLEIGERPDLEGSVQGRGSHLARHNLDVLRDQMAQLAS